MFKFKTANSPRLIQTVVNELLGEDEARRFWTAFVKTTLREKTSGSSNNQGSTLFVCPSAIGFLSHEGEQQKLEGPGYELLDQVVAWCKKEGLSVFWTCTAHPADRLEITSMTVGAIRFCLKAPRVRS